MRPWGEKANVLGLQNDFRRNHDLPWAVEYGFRRASAGLQASIDDSLFRALAQALLPLYAKRRP